MAFDGAGNYYIADPSNHLVVKVAASGTLSVVAGNGNPGYSGDNGPAVNAQLDIPWGVALDSAGNLYIGDAGNSTVRKVTTGGVITTLAGTGVPGFSGDNGPAATAQLSGPHGVVVDASGNLLIADTYNNRVRMVNSAGVISTIAGCASGPLCTGAIGGAATNINLFEPMGLATDSLGSLYIADASGSNADHTSLACSVLKVDPSGNITLVAGRYPVCGYSGDNGSAGLAYLNGPTGVTVDASGNVFIADTLNNRIRMVDTNRNITTVAGTGAPGFSGESGAPKNAALNHPSNVALDTGGKLYISDAANERNWVSP